MTVCFFAQQDSSSDSQSYPCNCLVVFCIWQILKKISHQNANSPLNLAQPQTKWLITLIFNQSIDFWSVLFERFFQSTDIKLNSYKFQSTFWYTYQTRWWTGDLIVRMWRRHLWSVILWRLSLLIVTRGTTSEMPPVTPSWILGGLPLVTSVSSSNHVSIVTVSSTLSAVIVIVVYVIVIIVVRHFWRYTLTLHLNQFKRLCINLAVYASWSNLNAFVTLLAKFIQVVFLLMCLTPVILLFFQVKINQVTFIHLLKSFSFKVCCINTATCFSKSKLSMFSSMKYIFWTTLRYSKGNHISLYILLLVCNIISNPLVHSTSRT